MKYILTSILIFYSFFSFSEGTRELAPNSEIIVNGRATTDIAALYIGSDIYGNFANFSSSATSTRLNIHVADPQSECLILGFGSGRDFDGWITRFQFHIKDPAGNVVYSSTPVTSNDNQISSWQEAINGPRSIVGADGYDQVVITSAQLMQQGWNGSGDYYIEFDDLGLGFDPFYISLWDISVYNCQNVVWEEKKGRIWSEQWALFSPRPRQFDSVFDRPFNGSFYIVAPDPDDERSGFVTRMNFNNSGFRGGAFTVALNGFGAQNTGNITEDRKSVQENNTIIGQYPVFLNDPVDLFETATFGELEIIGSQGCLPNNFCFKATSTESGEIELLLDLHGNDGIYNASTRDVLINYFVDPSEIGTEVCIPWNGVDGLGNKFEGTDYDSISVISSYRQGIYHFPLYDVEVNLNGFLLEAVRPSGASPSLYYDDSNIQFNSLTGSPNVNLAGCITPCHTWDWGNRADEISYGNFNTINSWWYARTLVDEAQVSVKFNKKMTETISFCAGEGVEFGDSLINKEGEHIFYFASEAGCDSTITINATSINLVAAIFSDANTLNCDNEISRLTASSTRPINNLAYLWHGPDTSSMGATDQIISITQPGIFAVTITENTIGCQAVDSIKIAEDYELPELAILEVPTLNCYAFGKKIVTGPVNQDLNYDISWTSSTGGFVAGEQTFSPTINIPGKYFVTTENTNNGCRSIDTVIVSKDTTSYISLSGEQQVDAQFCEEVFLNILPTSPHFDSISWRPAADLSCSDCIMPSLLVQKQRTFFAVVTDTNGCKSEFSIDVQPSEFYKVFIPDAFSPNNDGINDVFKMFSSPCAVDVIEFTLFNRWGAKVFEQYDFKSTDDIAWDGLFRDKHSEAGIYIYQAVIKSSDDQTHQLQGEVHLVR